MALNRDSSIEDRKREIDEELEEYSSRGIVSPAALKAARWISRGLWLAMSVLVVMLIYQVNQSVSQTRYDDLLKQHQDLQAEFKKQEAELGEMTGPILAEGSRLGLVTGANLGEVSLSRLALSIIDEGRKARAREEKDALVLVEMSDWRALRLIESGQAGAKVEEQLDAYRKAAAEQKIAELALAARIADGASETARQFFVALALARDGRVAERVVAIRWLAKHGRPHEVARKALESLLLDDRPLVANEARQALDAIK